jgi:trans-aconitate methyltransferase
MLDREASMTTLTQQIDWASWLTRWHRQQERYLHDRSRRFSIMLDYVEHLRGRGPLALIDLCCGPGSIAAAALTRFDTATVLACDIDPWLIEMGGAHSAPIRESSGSRRICAPTTGQRA